MVDIPWENLSGAIPYKPGALAKAWLRLAWLGLAWLGLAWHSYLARQIILQQATLLMKTAILDAQHRRTSQIVLPQNELGAPKHCYLE